MTSQIFAWFQNLTPSTLSASAKPSSDFQVAVTASAFGKRISSSSVWCCCRVAGCGSNKIPMPSQKLRQSQDKAAPYSLLFVYSSYYLWRATFCRGLDWHAHWLIDVTGKLGLMTAKGFSLHLHLRLRLFAFYSWASTARPGLLDLLISSILFPRLKTQDIRQAEVTEVRSLYTHSCIHGTSVQVKYYGVVVVVFTLVSTNSTDQHLSITAPHAVRFSALDHWVYWFGKLDDTPSLS